MAYIESPKPYNTMFAKAYSIARNFTLPIIICQRPFRGDCDAGMGTCVVINDEGWFVTAKHIIDGVAQLEKSVLAYQDLDQKRKKIEADTTLKTHDRIRQLNQLKVLPTTITNFSILIGSPTFKLGKVFVLNDIDLAVGKLENFNKSFIKTYPVFKDPTKPMDQGKSLCKLGFPFVPIKPTFDETNGFTISNSNIPLFPIEGIYTRTIHVAQNPSSPNKHPLKYIETSSPGLMGQSGGPTFDQEGTIWAIQSQTRHLKLGFGINTKGKEAEHLQNQYLNVGWGIHAETLTSFFRENKVSFQLSSY